MKKVFTFIIVFFMNFMFMKGNVFAAFTTTLVSSSGQTATYTVTSSIKYTNVKAIPGVGVSSATLTWNADGISGKLVVVFSSSDCKGEVKLKYDASEGCSSSTPKNCQAILDDARSMIGKIPYEMGGKCSADNFEACQFGRKYTDWASYKTTHHAYRPWSKESAVKSNYQRYENSYALTGLDCSGFVWWEFFRNGYDLVGRGNPHQSVSYANVTNLTSGSPIVYQISKEEAQPCDLVTSKKPENGNIPHIGIISQNAAGGGWLFIHENGTNANVAENCYFDCDAPRQGKAVYYWRVKTLWEGESEESSNTCSGEDTISLDNSEFCTCKFCDEVVITSDYVDGDTAINNCCLEGDSHIKEYFISQLFCSTEDPDIKISYYTDQCKNELYLDDVLKSKVDEEYCKIYCVEEMDLKTPKQIESATGKFFKLAELSYKDLDGNDKITKAPVITGSKICTIKIDYEKWRNEYEEIIAKEIIAFNSQQTNFAYYELYKDASKNVKELEQEIAVSCTSKTNAYRKKTTKAAKGSQYTNSSGETKTCNDANGCDDYEEYTPTKCENVKCTNKYTEYTVSSKPGISCTGGKCSLTYYNVKSNSTFTDKKTYNGLKLESYTQVATVNQVTAYPESNGCDSEVNKKIDDLSGSWNCTAGVGKEIPDDLEKLNMDSEAVKYKNAADQETRNLSSYTADATTHEEIMTKCQNFFKDDGEGAEPKTSHDSSDHFKLKPSATFKYMQVYLDGKTPASEWTPIDYGQAKCDYRFKNENVKDIECPTGHENCQDEYYSTKKFKSGSEWMEDLTAISTRVKSASEITKDTNKEFEKKLRQDAEYDAQCVWDNPDIPDEVTLYPGPLVKKYTAKEGAIYISRHKYQYAVYVVTYATKYETYWEIKDIGGSERTKDKFIKAFNDAAGTCAEIEINGDSPAYSDGGNESPENKTNDAIKPTCVMETIDGGMRIGTCQTGVGEIDVMCHENLVKEVYEFRVVDPREMFPGDWSDKAQNWKKTSGEWGPTYNTIKGVAQQDKTYAPENLTYSFKIDSKSIKAIKDYNSRTTYDDFNLECDCPDDNDIDNDGCGTIDKDINAVLGSTKCLNAGGKWKYTCRKCRSKFLRNLAVDGTIKDPNDNTEIANLSKPSWNNNVKTFDDIRNGNNWA